MLQDWFNQFLICHFLNLWGHEETFRLKYQVFWWRLGRYCRYESSNSNHVLLSKNGALQCVGSYRLIDPFPGYLKLVEFVGLESPAPFAKRSMSF